MGISGNLKTMALAELLQWLSMGQKTGTLRFEKASGNVVKRIFFDDGAIISSASTDPGEYLGRFLVSHGYLNEDAVNAAVARQKEEGKLLGKILVSMDLISEDDLHQMLRLKAEESIYDVFTWEEGAFEFLDGELPAEHMVRMELDVQWIVLEGTRRTDEWSRIQEVIPSPQCVPVIVVDLDQLEIEEFERSILEWVDDDRTVQEISEGAMTALFQVSEILAENVKQGHVKAVRPRTVEVRVEVPVTADGEELDEEQAAALAEKKSAQQDEDSSMYLPMMQQMMQQLQQQAQMQQVPQQLFQQMQQQMQQMQQMQAPQSAPPPQMRPAPPPGGASAVNVGGRSLNFATDGGTQAPAAPPPAAAPAPAGPKSEAQKLIERGDAALEEKDYETALTSFRDAKKADGAGDVVAEISAGIQKVEKALEREGIGASSVPKLKIDMSELMNLKIGPQEGFLLTRVDGSTDLKTLLRMTNVPKVDAFLLFWKLRRDNHVLI